MDAIGVRKLQTPLVGRLSAEIQESEYEPLERRLRWFAWLDDQARKLREDLRTIPQPMADEAEQVSTAEPGPLTPAQSQEYLQRLSDSVTEAVVQRVSDAIVIAVPVRTAAGRINARGVIRTITHASSLFLSSMASQVPLRGAVAIGVGTVSEDGAFLGPVLQEAYDLERSSPKGLRPEDQSVPKPKNWCRLIVSDRLYAWLEGLRNSDDCFEQEVARECQRVIVQDVSREWVVDYAGNSQDLARDLVHHACQFAIESENQCKLSKDSEDRLLEKAWNRVVQYLLPKLAIAGTPLGW